MTTTTKRDTYNNQLKKCQSIAKGRDAPSTIPKHLHLVRDPLTHNIVSQRMAKDNLAQIHPITTLKGRSHFTARKSPRHFKKNSASAPSIPSIETQRGVKSALRS